MTVQTLSQTMTAQEFGQHYALEHDEPLPPIWRTIAASILAGVANGPLKPPEPGRGWIASDFIPSPSQSDDPSYKAVDKPATVDQIMASARAAGMVP